MILFNYHKKSGVCSMKNKIKELFCWSFPDATKDIGDYSNKERNLYLAGMFGQNVIYSLIGSVLQVFYTDILIIPTIAVTNTSQSLWVEIASKL